MKHTPLLSTILSLFIGISLLAQNQQDFNNKEWTLIHQEQGINFYKKLCDCTDIQEGVYTNNYLLRIENTLNNPAKVEWQTLTYYNGKCAECNPAITREFSLGPKESIQGECNIFSKLPYLNIFESWIKRENKIKLSEIKISNVTVINFNKK